MKFYRVFAILAVLVPFAIGPLQAAERYRIDSAGAHFYAGFKVSHLGFHNMHGRFNKLTGEIVFDQQDIAASSVKVVIDTTSVDTNLAKRDAHLRSPDFFNTLEFPEMTFTSTKAEKTGEKTGRVSGDLTLLGVTKQVVLDVVFNKAGPHPRKKGTLMVGFSATGKLKRSDFGMKYGIGALSDEITLELEAEAILNK